MQWFTVELQNVCVLSPHCLDHTGINASITSKIMTTKMKKANSASESCELNTLLGVNYSPMFPSFPRPSKKRKSNDSAEVSDEFSVVKTAVNEEDAAMKKLNKALNHQKKEKTKELISRVIIVRNVAFQASQSEVTALFKPIGGLVKVRMPQKPSGGHRGFAFVEFASEDQAKVGAFIRRFTPPYWLVWFTVCACVFQSALETFGVDTHFMGRRLNIEYAKSD